MVERGALDTVMRERDVVTMHGAPMLRFFRRSAYRPERRQPGEGTGADPSGRDAPRLARPIGKHEQPAPVQPVAIH
jgi:hypothetical protein